MKRGSLDTQQILSTVLPQLHSKEQHIKHPEMFLNQIVCLPKLPNRSRGSFCGENGVSIQLEPHLDTVC